MLIFKNQAISFKEESKDKWHRNVFIYMVYEIKFPGVTTDIILEAQHINSTKTKI